MKLNKKTFEDALAIMNKKVISFKPTKVIIDLKRVGKCLKRQVE